MVTQFGLRPPELLELFPMLWHYFRWFHISSEAMEPSEIVEGLHVDLGQCLWIDGLQRRVHLRRNALGEVKG